jgi:hypothetical protein
MAGGRATSLSRYFVSATREDVTRQPLSAPSGWLTWVEVSFALLYTGRPRHGMEPTKATFIIAIEKDNSFRSGPGDLTSFQPQQNLSYLRAELNDKLEGLFDPTLDPIRAELSKPIVRSPGSSLPSKLQRVCALPLKNGCQAYSPRALSMSELAAKKGVHRRLLLITTTLLESAMFREISDCPSSSNLDKDRGRIYSKAKPSIVSHHFAP